MLYVFIVLIMVSAYLIYHNKYSYIRFFLFISDIWQPWRISRCFSIKNSAPDGKFIRA